MRVLRTELDEMEPNERNRAIAELATLSDEEQVTPSVDPLDEIAFRAVRVEHTAGPWEALPSGGVVRTLFDGRSGGVLVADLYAGGGGLQGAEREANAHLIAAAPDLLAACKIIVAAQAHEYALLDKGTGTATRNGRMRLSARAAVAKAEGRFTSSDGDES